ncbi:MAG: hypothetical protein ACI3XG_07855 [Faecousia sp.]
MRRFFWISLALLLVPAADWFWQKHVLLDGRVYDRTATVLVLGPEVPEEPEQLARFSNLYWLDLRGGGLSGAEYEAVSREAGDARILWELDFQGKPVSADAKVLEIDHLTDTDVGKLRYLPKLQRVEAESCRDYPQLMALMEQKPDCQVSYTVELGDAVIGCRETAPVPGRCSPEALRQALELLPGVRQMDLRQTGISAQQARQLAEEFPHIRFLWEEQLGGAAFLTNAREIDLSGVAMESTEAVEELLPYLPEAEKIIMCDCGIPSPEMAALGARHPEIRFVWRVKLGPLSARTDDTWFAPITKHQLIGGSDADELKYCTDMECIDLGHCWIRDCEWARGMKNLRYLVLADTYVKDLTPLSGLKKLAYLELFVTPVRDYSPLLGCTGLEDLNLGYTYGDPTPISQMTWLKNLWWGGIHYVPWVNGQSPAAMLQHGLPDTRVTLYAGSSTGLGWRNLPHYYEMRDMIGMYYMSG